MAHVVHLVVAQQQQGQGEEDHPWLNARVRHPRVSDSRKDLPSFCGEAPKQKLKKVLFTGTVTSLVFVMSDRTWISCKSKK